MAARALQARSSEGVQDQWRLQPWDLTAPPRVPVMRPRLVDIECAAPYLRSIDQRRVYSNYGPLNAEFEARLAARYGAGAGAVVTCSNATSGLTQALLAVTDEDRDLCAVPAWTFVATAHAVVAAGMTPYLLDVDPATGALTPEIVAAALASAPGRVSAAMPVAPFGRPLDAASWEAFQDATGVKVVIDAAAGFDGLAASRVPSVVSLHATKVFGVGEGGFLLSTDEALVAAVRRRCNFGFQGARDALSVGCNSKISEYTAAVGLASLDQWPVLRSEHEEVLQAYLEAVADEPRIRTAGGMGRSWVCSTFCIETEEAAVLEVERRLTEVGIATRRWWGGGVHRHQAFGHLPRAELSVTDALASRTLGLPCWPGLDAGVIGSIAGVVKRVVREI